MSPRINLPLTTEHALLGFLRRRPMYGYEIHQQLSDSAGLGLVWHLKQSQLYALLSKLEQQGYIKATLEPQASRPPRKVFELTGAGEAAFLDWVQRPVKQGRRLRLDFLAKLYFAREEGLPVMQTLIDRQQTACRDWLAEQQAQAEGLEQSAPYDWLVHAFRMNQTRAMLDWLDTCRRTLLAGQLPSG